MKYLSILLLVITISIGITSCSYDYRINSEDNIDDEDELAIKKLRYLNDFALAELETLYIEFLGTVDNYNIYYVETKANEDIKDYETELGDHYISSESWTRIVGVHGKVYTLLELINETKIDQNGLFDILPERYKKSEDN